MKHWNIQIIVVAIIISASVFITSLIAFPSLIHKITPKISPSKPSVLGWSTNCNWIGASGGNWNVDTNWDCAGVNRIPTDSDRATIDASVTVNITAATTVDDLVIGDATGTYAPILNFSYDAILNGALTIDEGDLTLYSNATITHTAGTTAIVGRVNISIPLGNATIAGSINLNAKGYTGNGGPCKGTGGRYAGGGGHGGEGGNANSGIVGGGICDSLVAPIDLGSGGGVDSGYGNGYGGGAVKLSLPNGTLSLTGSIVTVGQNSNQSGSGAGGSVYIITNTLSGAGTINANGGNPTNAGSGGGGRIALYYTTDSSTITATAYGGTTTTGGYGAAGTIYKESSGIKTAIVDNGGRNQTAKFTNIAAGISLNTLTVTNYGTLRADTAFTATTLNVTNYGYVLLQNTGNVTYTTFNWTTNGIFLDRGGTFALFSGGGDLVIPATVKFYADTARSYTNVTINGTVTHSTNSSAATYVLRHTITNNGTYLINSTGSINISGQGYGGNYGPCKGTGGSAAGGGGHGGEGGNANYAGGGVCDSLTQPLDLGSGGGIDGGWGNGNGGGSVKLDITGGTLTMVSGATINANGLDKYQSGAGAGGSIYIIANAITGAGTISANGGVGNNSGGGGGGRIALYYTTDTSTITCSAYGGTSNYQYGAAGTIYKEISGGTKSVIIDNGGRAQSVKFATLPSPLTVDIVTLNGYGSLRADGSLTVTTLNLTNTASLQVLSTANISYTTFNWATSGVIIDRGGTFALLSSGGDLTIPATTTLYADTARSYTNITVNGTVTHSTNGGTATYLLRHTITGGGTYTINSGGSVNVNNRGYSGNSGPCPGTGGSSAGGGGAGGEGGNGTSGRVGGGICGSLTAPVDLGSGGGVDGGWGSGNGGGSVKLDITGGTLTMAGSATITANGTDIRQSGAGAGGSIYIIANVISGTGTISANGGAGNGSGGGGGGRIAVYYTSDTSTITYATYGGTASSGTYGAAGTIYKEQSGGNKTVIIDNGNRAQTAKYATLPAGLTADYLYLNSYGNFRATTAITVTNISMTNTSRLYLTSTGNITDTNFTWASSSIIYDEGGICTNITNGILNIPATTTLYADTQSRSFNSVSISGTLTTTANTTTETYKISHIVNGNYVVNTGGLIDLQSKGFTSANGTGKGTNSTSGSGGAGYGGIGGAGSAAAGGVTYGDEFAPISVGSGGGEDGSGNGGKGGGAIFIDATGNVTVNGNIYANAGNYVNLDSGGGSGGSIYIRTGGTFGGNGNLYAKGGNGNATTGGGGAGGRISIIYNVWGWTGNTLSPAAATAGGTGKNPGNVGTVNLGTLNNLPIAQNVIIDGGATAINLTENTTTAVSCVATVSDADSFLDIDGVTAKLYRTGVGANAADNELNHYTLAGDAQCIPSGGIGTTENYTCTFNVYYDADATDAGSSNESDSWTCQVTPYDGGGNGFAATDDIEMNTLRALSVPASLNYGQLTIGGYSLTNVLTPVSNTGNSTIDITVRGTDLCTNYPACNSYTIPVSSQQYSVSNFTYGSGIPLTTSDTTVQTNLIKTTSHTLVSSYTLTWGIGVPPTQKSGFYTGQNVFTAIADQ